MSAHTPGHCVTPICAACNLGPCPNRAESGLLAALKAIERITRSKGMTDAERKAAMRDIGQHASAAIAKATGDAS